MVTRTPTPRRWMGPIVLGAALLLPAGVLAGCSDSQKDDLRSTASSLGTEASNAASSAAPRAAAEAMRASLVADRTADSAGTGTATPNPRSIDRLREAADNVPGDPQITGIEDGDGDGADDDGKVQFQVEDNFACLTVGTDGGTDVTSERC